MILIYLRNPSVWDPNTAHVVPVQNHFSCTPCCRQAQHSIKQCSQRDIANYRNIQQRIGRQPAHQPTGMLNVKVCSSPNAQTSDSIRFILKNRHGIGCKTEWSNNFPNGQLVQLSGQQLGTCNVDIVEDQQVFVQMEVSASWYGHDGKIGIQNICIRYQL